MSGETKRFDGYSCQECGKRRINTPSGSVCPDGHGKLKPQLPKSIGGVAVGSRLGVFQEDDRDEDDGWDDDEWGDD